MILNHKIISCYILHITLLQGYRYMYKKNSDIIKSLYERNLIAQITKKKELNNILQSKSIKLYCGFDPTADSLHIGHLIPLLCLRKFQKMGHQPIILIGGGTGLIGDPSFKHSERKIHSPNIIQEWIEKIKNQIPIFIDCSKSYNNTTVQIVNNYNWYTSISALQFISNIGRYFSINKMIKKDTIKKRFQKNNSGISYAEFSYNLLQSYDFSYLYKHFGVILQIGGSDQWGNIVSGINLVYRLYKKTVYGLTMSLITKSDNTKFGKTEKDTIWLDPKKTSPYKFYQYWINSSDTEVYRFLNFFTEISTADINILKKEQKQNTSQNIKPKAQIILAAEVTRLVHGSKNLYTAQRISENLFTGKILKLTLDDFVQLSLDGIPTINLKLGTTLQQALVQSKLAASKKKARELIISNSITINTQKQLNTKYIFCATDILHNQYTLLKRGKKNYCLIQWI